MESEIREAMRPHLPERVSVYVRPHGESYTIAVTRRSDNYIHMAAHAVDASMVAFLATPEGAKTCADWLVARLPA